MLSITFFVNTDPFSFSKYVEKHFGWGHIIDTEVDERKLTLQNPRSEGAVYGKPERIIIEGFHVIQHGDSGYAWSIGDVIRFELLSIALNRIEVNSMCSNELVAQLYGRLLGEIARAYPEARDDIYGQLGIQSPGSVVQNDRQDELTTLAGPEPLKEAQPASNIRQTLSRSGKKQSVLLKTSASKYIEWGTRWVGTKSFYTSRNLLFRRGETPIGYAYITDIKRCEDGFEINTQKKNRLHNQDRKDNGWDEYKMVVSIGIEEEDKLPVNIFYDIDITDSAMEFVIDAVNAFPGSIWVRGEIVGDESKDSVKERAEILKISQQTATTGERVIVNDDVEEDEGNFKQVIKTRVMRGVYRTPDEFSIPGLTLGAARGILKGLAHKENDPAMIVLLYEPGCLPGAIKLMITSSDGKRVADELHRGTFRITPTQNPEGIRIAFQRGDFPDGDLFTNMVNKIAQALGAEQVEDGGKRKRQRNYRTDVVSRVALALYLKDKERLSRRGAAYKARTTTEAMKEYEDLAKVQTVLSGFREKPDLAKIFQAKLPPKRVGK